jgi:hypothetical protein
MMESVSPVFNRKISGSPAAFGQFGLLVALCLFGSLSANAQDYARRLTWSAIPKTMVVVGDKKITQPTFTNAAHLQQYGMLPVYNEIIPLSTAGAVSVQVLNPVYSAATNIDNGSLKYIAASVIASGNLTFQRKQPKAFVSVLPFRKNPSTGAIEKLESFTLKLTITPNAHQSKALNTYAASSVLSSGTWYKVSVTADGIYKIDYNFLKKTIGVDPSTININKLVIFGNGGGMVPDQNSVARPDDLTENPTMFVDANGNGQFDNGDYLLFYGQMPDNWTLNPANKQFYHSKNLYADATFYFLTIDAGTGKRVTTETASGTPNKTFNYFDEHAYRDNDQYNLLQSGKEWLGDELTSFSTSESFSLSYPNLITSDTLTFISSVAVNASYPSTTAVVLNGVNLINHYDNGIQATEYPAASVPQTQVASILTNSSNLNISYNFQVTSDPSGTAAFYIDWFEILFKRSLALTGDAMPFRNIASVGTGNVSAFQLTNATSNTLVWDVTSIGAIQQMSSSFSGSQLNFTVNTDQMKEFIAFNSNASFANPTYIDKVPNQNLHATGQPNLVIVTYDDFKQASDDLAAYHIANDNVTASVILLSQIYNEFGSGKSDISAIRDFMEMLYQRAGNDTTKLPRFLLLMGDGSFDPKNDGDNGRTPGANNFIPTYQSSESNNQLSTYTSDDFYGLLDQNEGGAIENGNQLLDLSVGRLPVESESEAEAMVTKIKAYKSSSTGCMTCAKAATNNSWRNIITMIADYQFDGGNTFEDASDGLCETTRAQYPQYNYNKIYTDAYKLEATSAGDRFPDVNTAILNSINTGTLLVNWVGHGGPTNWSNARTFNMADIVQLANQFYPIFITATCDFSRFDQPSRTAGEWIVVNGTGGGIGSITTTRLVFEYDNATINSSVFQYLFAPYKGRYPTIGEVTMLSKNAVISQTDPVNTRKFMMLGDPVVTLDYPHYNVATTMVDNKPVTAPHDTLKALTKVTISGQVTDSYNNVLTNFSGTIYPVVYDKISSITTLDNLPALGSPFTFQEYKSILYKGQASVTNGKFSFTFVVPKDINYQYGPGRISYYATNGALLDASGYSNAITVGGSSDTGKTYGTGPKMNVYMDDEKFVYGGITSPSPLLLVELQDPGGINTAGNGVGHNMTAVLDNNSQNAIVLNNYYQTALNDFTQGEVRYPFSNLTLGNHTITVKAWDIYDQSTVSTTEFLVTNNAKLALNHVYNYPNPFTTHTEFMFEHNMPCTELNVSIQIYSVSGKLVKNIVQQVQTTGYRVDGIVWDGLDDYGSAIGKGVYVYKVTARDANGDVANKFEKLVLLR